ncbi:molybdopterin-dependent oxidoreductase [Roseomonas chloroacetimidivorans]|uniref:SorA family sulfite dehydrogenase catalytic subunit n=1 Tax=Roseomonas chloroacetimidivorans TaxID=1766656 RepID=UPI003C71E2D4
MIRLTSRPPQLETPFSVYGESVITPNDAFFVRYHLAGNTPPQNLDPDTYRVTVKGKVQRSLSLSLADIKALPGAREIVAVNQCSGNSRGFFEPRVAGGQAANGLMGNARWRGVPLKAVLDRAGVAAGAVQVSFNGLDEPVFTDTPDFTKALGIDHARDGEVMLAWGMNGTDLPVLNGYPLRLVVPGYYGTYWVKHLHEITVLDKPSDSFWMTTAYRIPDNDCACVEPGAAAPKTRPIGRYNVRSFITAPAAAGRVAADRDIVVKGFAFDGGSGIARVEVSPDGGQHWTVARLGEDLGNYSFRAFEAGLRLPAGEHRLMSRATGRDGGTQPLEARWNPPGYMRNVVETVTVTAA